MQPHFQLYFSTFFIFNSKIFEQIKTLKTRIRRNWLLIHSYQRQKTLKKRPKTRNQFCIHLTLIQLFRVMQTKSVDFKSFLFATHYQQRSLVKDRFVTTKRNRSIPKLFLAQGSNWCVTCHLTKCVLVRKLLKKNVQYLDKKTAVEH